MATKALSIVELLEQILSYLPCVDIMRARRISTFWVSTITKSSILQPALFAETRQLASSVWLQQTIRSAKNAARNGYYDRQRPKIGFVSLKHDYQVTLPQVSAAITGTTKEVIVNPFLQIACAMPITAMKFPQLTVAPVFSILYFFAFSAGREYDWQRKLRTLRSMLLTQPGAKKVQIKHVSTINPDGWWKTTNVVAEHGFVTVGDLLDYIVSTTKRAGEWEKTPDEGGILFMIEKVME